MSGDHTNGHADPAALPLFAPPPVERPGRVRGGFTMTPPPARHEPVVVPRALPRPYAGELDWGLVAAFRQQASDRLSAALADMIDQGLRCTGVEYSKARDGITLLNRLLEDLFDGYDAILTPATQGAAPVGLAFTGSPMFCTIWSLCGVPAISLPILRGEEGMPLGAQLVAAKGRDAHLLRIADWLARRAPRAEGNLA